VAWQPSLICKVAIQNVIDGHSEVKSSSLVEINSGSACWPIVEKQEVPRQPS
jgi:hypothetical protein